MPASSNVCWASGSGSALPATALTHLMTICNARVNENICPSPRHVLQREGYQAGEPHDECEQRRVVDRALYSSLQARKFAVMFYVIGRLEHRGDGAHDRHDKADQGNCDKGFPPRVAEQLLQESD